MTEDPILPLVQAIVAGELSEVPSEHRKIVCDWLDGWRAQLAAETPDGAALIAAERRRQVEEEDWTPEHDAEHADEGLALAAACYAVPGHMRKYRMTDPMGLRSVPTLWPWEATAWKPNPDDRERELVKAGALIAAEIDRLRARR